MALEVAAQALEAAVRRGDVAHPDNGRHTVVCAAAYHLAGFAAQSFSVLPPPVLGRNLASVERALGMLLRRDLLGLRGEIVQWLGDEEHSDEAIARKLADEDNPFGIDDATYVALSESFYRGLGAADTALIFGDISDYARAIQLLREVADRAGLIGNLPIWWAATLGRHLFRDLRENSLHVRLPPEGEGLPDLWSELRSQFIAQLVTRRPPHIELWPSQLAAAARSLDPSDDLIIALPTSAGKTRIAELCILRALAGARRVVYVTPLRALSAQVERVLSRTFVPLGFGVTSLYGAAGATSIDTESLAQTQIVVSTPEKIDFALRQDPTVIDDVGLIVFDEGHMIGLGSREIRYEVLIQRLLRRPDADERRIVCLSAMFNSDDPDFKDFTAWLRNDVDGDPVQVRWRPTRQRFATLDWSKGSKAARLGLLYGEEAYVPRFFEERPPRARRKKPFPDSDIEFCISAANAFARDGQSVLVYSPQRGQVEPLVRNFVKAAQQGYLTDVPAPSPADLELAMAIGREWLGEGHPAVEGLRVGVGAHHGALPRPFLAAVERLLDSKRLSVVVASPTLAQGIDLACSVLLFRSLFRFDAQTGKPGLITAAEFANVAGRAGRAFVDLDGLVVLPSYEGKGRAHLQGQFAKLIQDSKGQRLRSGLARLVLEISARLAAKLGVAGEDLVEYVVNQRSVWDRDDVEGEEVDADPEDGQRGLDEYLADLDVAILSLVEQLDTEESDLAELLDQVLTGSLWQRTLARASALDRSLATGILTSRAQWLWGQTQPNQRKACYLAGLGSCSGLFLHAHLDQLVDILADLNIAAVTDNAAEVKRLAVAFAEAIHEEPYFFVRNPPANWREILERWVGGVAFAEILGNLGVRDAQRVQAFIQDCVVFKLVWAAEAVRVMAGAEDHPRATDLGDGPALAFGYGAYSVSAALLCQIGFASRVGAHWVCRETAADFVTMEGFWDWIAENGEDLSTDEFWDSLDHARLWAATASPGGDFPRKWKREVHVVSVDWVRDPPAPGSRVRVVARAGRAVDVCSIELAPLGRAQLPFNPSGAYIDAVVEDDSFDDDPSIRIEYFGR